MNPYDTLNVPTDADAAAIKKAYKKEAQRAHPDREGGSDEAFHQVALAADVLLDPERRGRYDDTGSVEDTPNPRSAAENKLIELFNSIVNAEEFTGNVIDTCKSKVATVVVQLDNQLMVSMNKKIKLEKQLGRVTTKDFNLYEQILTSTINDLKKNIDHLTRERGYISEVSKMLEEYEDGNPQVQQTSWGGTSTSFNMSNL